MSNTEHTPEVQMSSIFKDMAGTMKLVISGFEAAIQRGKTDEIARSIREMEFLLMCIRTYARDFMDTEKPPIEKSNGWKEQSEHSFTQ